MARLECALSGTLRTIRIRTIARGLPSKVTISSIFTERERRVLSCSYFYHWHSDIGLKGGTAVFGAFALDFAVSPKTHTKKQLSFSKESKIERVHSTACSEGCRTSAMPFKVAGMFTVLVAAVSFGAQSTEDARKAGAFGRSIDVIAVILSFFGPMEWSQLGKVGPLWTEAIPNGIAEYLRSHGTPVDTKEYKIIVCSEEGKMERLFDSLTKQPGFRGAIFNKDRCTLINHSLKGSQVCSENGRVRITGVADVEGCDVYDKSKCNDHFLYRTDHKLHVRNILTGKDITIDGISAYTTATMVNEKQLVIVQSDEISMYELDWDANTAKCVLRERKEGEHPPLSHAAVSTHECGDVSSVLCHTDDNLFVFQIESKKWKIIPRTRRVRTIVSPDGKIIFSSLNGMSIRTTDGKTTLLKIPGGSNFNPSPNSQFVGFYISSKYGIMNLRSREITVITDLTNFTQLGWTSDTLLRIHRKDGRRILRCAKNPSVDLVTLHKDDSLIQRVKVGDELDASDLFSYLVRIGPNLYCSQTYHRVIQVQWMNKHDH